MNRVSACNAHSERLIRGSSTHVWICRREPYLFVNRPIFCYPRATGDIADAPLKTPRVRSIRGRARITNGKV